MKCWRMVLRVSYGEEESYDLKALKKDLISFMRVEETHELSFLGINVLGVDFKAKDCEFNHIMRLIKILEGKYKFFIMKFEELCDGGGEGVAINLGRTSMAKVG
ncbi:hypothetical protein NCCP2165_18140 [Halomonas sp. NCCP-2165]|nr:hypothetical protein NCCP2165_18140 [Halomonas sp. NCCP-2165]